VEDAREAVAALLEVEARDVILTSGGTEANNLALQGAVGLAASRIDHPSVTRVAEHLEAQGTPVAWLPVTRGGAVDIDGVGRALARLPPQSTVALTAVNHETGVCQPVGEVACLVCSAGARLHVDAVQAIGKLAPSQYSCADSLTLAAHKFRGPKGIGALVWRMGEPFRPVLLGGAQERGLRPGTQDAVACVGFRVAVEHARTTPTRYEGLAAERDRLETMLLRHGQRNGDPISRAPHVSNVSIDGWVGDELVAALDLEGVCVSSGSACSAGTAEPSPVVTEMVGEGRARRAIRISLGETTTSDQVDRVLAVLPRLFNNAAG
jgi:cysteine desulfurase